MRIMATQMETATECRARRLWAILGVLFFLTVAVHFCWAVHFWTKAHNNAPKTSLNWSGDAFLVGFPGWNSNHEFDAAAYNRAAAEVLRTGVPRDRDGVYFNHAPLYAYLLAGCYWLGGIRFLSIVVPQAILSGLIGFSLALTAKSLAKRNKAISAVAASLIIFASVRQATEVGNINPAILLFSLFCAALLSVAQSQRSGHLTIFVIVLIMATYVMASFFLVSMAAAAWLAWLFWQTRKTAY